MKSRNLAFLPLTLALGLVANAQAGNVNVSVSAGSVTAMDTSNGATGAWGGLTGSASGATISYQTGTSTGATSEFKFSGNDNGNPGAQTFNGVNANGSTVTGASQVTSVSGAPTYYQAAWTASSSSSSPGQISGSGTYDPWTVSNGDLQQVGTKSGGTATLYYQTGLLGFPTSTGFNLSPGQSGSYNFQVGASTVTNPFLNVVASKTYGGAATFVSTLGNVGTQAQLLANMPGFYLYFLGSNAENPRVTPSDRLNNGTLITSISQINSIFSVYSPSNPNGMLDNNATPLADLNFALVDIGQSMTSDPSGNILSWDSNTNQVSVQATPEPASVAALGLGVVALVRRRKRS